MEHVLRYDAAEAALPHQVEPPKEWGFTLPQPVEFEVTLPKWCPMDQDSLVSLHWWASLSAHLHCLLAVLPQNEGKAHYRVDKALRHELQLLRDLFGGTVSAAISVAGCNAKAKVPPKPTEEQETGYWTMSIQTAFGLLCVQAAAKGKEHETVTKIQDIYDLIRTAFAERLGEIQAYNLMIALCTGTQRGTVDEKLEQWQGALAKAAEGLPAEVPGVEGALENLHEAQQGDDPHALGKAAADVVMASVKLSQDGELLEVGLSTVEPINPVLAKAEPLRSHVRKYLDKIGDPCTAQDVQAHRYSPGPTDVQASEVLANAVGMKLPILSLDDPRCKDAVESLRAPKEKSEVQDGNGTPDPESSC